MVQATIAVGHDDPGWRNVDAVCLQDAPVRRLPNRHGGPASQEFRQDALSVSRQVQHDDKSEAAIHRHVLKETLEGLDPASGRANADDRYLLLVGLNHVCAVCCLPGPASEAP